MATPQKSHPPSGIGISDQRAFLIAAAITAVVFLAGIYACYFIVDSWSYLELSNSIFHDFYRFNTLRQFESTSPYSNTFPPLWPVLLGATRRVLDLGIYTGYLLNCLFCIALLALLMRLFRRLGLEGWVGAACYLALLSFKPFLLDALGAKTMPLALTLLTGTLLIVLSESIPLSRVALAGVLMGLACLNRTDAMPVAGLLGLALAIRVRRDSSRTAKGAAALLVYGVCFVMVLSPWMAYGRKHFGKLFISDNSRQVITAYPGNVLDYYLIPPVSDFAQNPGKWVSGLVRGKLRLVARGFYDNLVISEVPELLLLWAIGWAVTRPRSLPASVVRFGILALVLIPVILLPQVLVGYWDSRYYSAPILLLCASAMGILVSLRPGIWKPSFAIALLLAVSLPLGISVAAPLYHSRGSLLAPTRTMAPLAPTAGMQQLSEAVRRDAAGQPHRVMLTTGYIETAKYGALTGEPTSVMPRLVGGDFAQFAREWHVTHLYDPAERPAVVYPLPPVADSTIMMRAIRIPGVELIPLDLPGLYRVKLAEQPPLPPLTAMLPHEYWMYTGTYTSSGGKGIYLFKFHADSGRLESAAGVAAGRLWQANIDSLTSSLPRVFAQLVAGWPHPSLMLKGVDDPTDLAIHPSGQYLYTADSSKAGTASAFQIDRESGKLTILNTKPAGGSLPDFVTVDRSGRNLLVSNYGGTVAVLPIAASGRLKDPTCVIQHRGTPSQSPHPHSIYVSADNRFVLVMDAGLDEVMVYRFDADQGKLSPADPPFLHLPGSMPRHLAFHPNGRIAYILGENSQIITAQWDAESGRLTVRQTIGTLSPDFHGRSGAADIVVHPNGRFVYATNRGDGTVAVFAIDASTGTLTPIQYTSVEGKQPSNLVIDPTGEYLIVSNVFSSNLTQLQIDTQTGLLTPTGYRFAIPSPAGMAFIPAKIVK